MSRIEVRNNALCKPIPMVKGLTWAPYSIVWQLFKRNDMTLPANLQVFDITQASPAAVSSTSTSYATNNANAINNAISAATAAGGGIVYVPPSAHGFIVENGFVTISNPGIILAGIGSMASPQPAASGSPTTLGPSTIIPYGGSSGQNNIVIRHCKEISAPFCS